MNDPKQFTFTFNKADETNFRRILGRLEDDQYTVIQPISPVIVENTPYITDMDFIAVMESESASMFRLGMKHVKIKRLRSEEEEAEQEAIREQHRVKITVYTGNNGTEE